MFIDIHHPLIYGVDDGARNFEGTQRLVEAACADGIGYIITTPHITPGQVPFPLEDYYAHLRETQDWCAAQGYELQLYTGAEILYTPETPRLLREGQVPTLAGSRFALLEFSPTDSYSYIQEAVRRVGSAGFVPVVAHAERYDAIKKIDQLNDLKDNFGARIQINARTVIRKHSYFRGRWIRKIFDSGVVDYLATDAHDMPDRHACMMEAYHKLAQDYGEQAARALTGENAMEIFH